jgi:hypothetical protein
MALDPFELVELRLLERGGLVGSDGRDWLRVVIGVAATLVVVLGVGFMTGHIVPVLTLAMFGTAATVLWTVHAGRKMVCQRVAELRSRTEEISNSGSSYSNQA